METATFELKLPGAGKISWFFQGQTAIERLALLQRLVIPAGESIPGETAVKVTVRHTPVFSWSECPWPPDLTICSCAWISIGYRHSFHDIEVLLHDNGGIDKPHFEIFQIQWTFWYGFLALLLQGKVLPVHGALLARNDRGVVVSGPSGTGKSTCAARVPAPCWEALADDAVLISRNGNEFFAQGLPTWSQLLPDREIQPIDLNRAVKLAGSFQLVQASADKLETVTNQEKLSILIHQFFDLKAMWKVRQEGAVWKNISESMMDFVLAEARNLQVGRLHCSLTGEFWKELEKIL